MYAEFKKRAIQLRKKGLTYSEILKQIPVAKSTLSLWLREVGLSKPQKQRITQKRLIASLRGAEARKKQRIEITKKIQNRAQKEVGNISKRELWLIGVALYWAEGAKEKEWSSSVGVDFINSDPYLIKLFIKWLLEISKIQINDIKCRIYIHENHSIRISEVHRYWLKVTGIPEGNFYQPYFKKHNPKTKRKNTETSYHGLLRIVVKKSTNLNRQIAGWTKGIIENC